jgi:hypothetical protein
LAASIFALALFGTNIGSEILPENWACFGVDLVLFANSCIDYYRSSIPDDALQAEEEEIEMDVRSSN